MTYILVTPVRNEENNLPYLANCIINQTVLPLIWLILDDCSIDNTSNIIEQLENKYQWIKSSRIEIDQEGQLDQRFGKLCNTAFGEAIGYCHSNNIRFSYLIKVDADILLPNNCIEIILSKFNCNERLGIASPHIIDASKKFDAEELQNMAFSPKMEWYDIMSWPTDGLRIYRKETFEEIDWVPETIMPDTVAIAKAKMKGWHTMRFTDVVSIKTRVTTGAANTKCTSANFQGFGRYYLGYHPFVVLLSALLEVLRGKTLFGFAIFWEYLKAAFKREPRIPDNDVREYFSKRQPLEIIKAILRQVK